MTNPLRPISLLMTLPMSAMTREELLVLNTHRIGTDALSMRVASVRRRAAHDARVDARRPAVKRKRQSQALSMRMIKRWRRVECDEQ